VIVAGWRLQSASSGDELEHEDDQSDHKQSVDQATSDVDDEKPEKPQDEENGSNSVKHFCNSVLVVASMTLGQLLFRAGPKPLFEEGGAPARARWL
jgi:hypothetical protein